MAKGKGQIKRYPKEVDIDISVYIGRFLTIVIAILIYGSMYKYLDDLEKNKDCKCSENNKRGLLKKLVILSLVVSIVINLLPIIIKNGALLQNLGSILGFVSFGLFVYSCYTFFKYEKFLYKNDCKCSEDIKKTVYRYYLYMVIVLYTLAILFNLFFIFIIILASGKNNNVARTNL